MKELKIKREKQIVSGISKMKIFINDEFVGNIKSNEEKSFFYNSNEFTLKVKYYWLSTRVSQVKLLKEVTSFTVSFNVSNKLFIIFGIIINLLSILFFYTRNSLVLIAFYLTITYFIYVLMFKRNRIILKNI